MKPREKEEVNANIYVMKLAIQKAINEHCQDVPETTNIEISTALNDIMLGSLSCVLTEITKPDND